jgi:hypothetical protein
MHLLKMKIISGYLKYWNKTFSVFKAPNPL